MSDSESCTSPPLGSSSPKSANPKRCNKPQMEKKRRERINLSLNVLKQLVLEALKKDTSQYSKLEKADILEMTVKHLRDLQRRQLHSAASTDTSVAGKYRAGFTECASEVTRYLSTVDGLKPDVRDRLMQHLNGCVHRVNVPAQQPMQVTSASVAQAQAHYTQQQAVTATSCMNVLPVASVASSTVPATRPIQIQIPVATSPTSLPGAGVQALQLAASIPTAAVQQQRTPSPQQHTSATFSPVSAPAYIGAFQVIPSAQAAFMLPQGSGQQIGLVNPSGAIYATVNTSPVQQAQLQQMILSQAHLMTATTQQTTTTTATATTGSLPPSSVSGKRRADGNHHTDSSQAVKKMMTRCDPVCGVKVGVKAEIQDEKVWRPW